MPDRVDPTVADTPGGEQRVEAAAVRLAMELGHTMQSVEPMRAAPNTVRIARNVLLSADAVDPLRSPATTDDELKVIEEWWAPSGVDPVSMTKEQWMERLEGWTEGREYMVKVRLAKAYDHIPALLSRIRSDQAAIARLVEAAQELETIDCNWCRHAVGHTGLRAALDSLPPSLKVATEEGEGGE